MPSYKTWSSKCEECDQEVNVKTPLKNHEETKHEHWSRTWAVWLVCVMNVNGKRKWRLDVVTPMNDVWPRCDECDYKTGVSTSEASYRSETLKIFHIDLTIQE